MKLSVSLLRSVLAVSCLLPVMNTCVAASPANTLSPTEERGGWRLLFDGKSGKGWRNYQKDALGDGWKIADGVIEWTKKGAGDIITDEQFENFELTLEYRISKGGNSGLMFHVTEEEKRPWQTGPEVQIQDNVDGHDPQKAGWLYQLYKPRKPAWVKGFEKQAGLEAPDTEDATRPAGQWNHLYLRISPRGCEVAMNGVSYYKFNKGSDDWNKRVAKSKFAKMAKFGKATKGHICLQDHGNQVAFRNIKVRELNAKGEVTTRAKTDTLPLKGVEAFPNISWEGWEGVDDNGKVQNFRPIVVTHGNDGSNRIFVASQRGAIYVFPKSDDAGEAKLFLDIREKVHPWKRDNEEGLLGLAFHPDYKKNGQFFVYYSSEKELRTSVVSKFTVSDDPDKADPKEEVIMKLKQPFANHNGGSICFGKDGYLYIALGDGGSRNDPMKNGQNLGTLLGSMLRIDVDSKADGKNYGIPADNPFVKVKGAQPEIFAYGFRNIWRMSVDRQTGDVWAADVGQDFWEEVNVVTKGGNYGWSVQEASFLFNNVAGEGELIDPVWEYDHQAGKSITGGYVYRGSRLPELAGNYLYADFISGQIWALEYDRASGKASKNRSIATTGFPVLAFGEDQDGEVYYTMETVTGKGIYKFVRK